MKKIALTVAAAATLGLAACTSEPATNNAVANDTYTENEADADTTNALEAADNALDSAGNAIENAADAVGDAAEGAGNTVENTVR